MTIEQELREIEGTMPLRPDTANMVITKLISFIRHQADVIAAKDSTLELFEDPITEWGLICMRTKAIKARESLEGGE